ncbi:hypothetical protein IWW36_005979 [Coemansia brasiliensis]|uniref:tRNA-splicing endonuclease subunit Sen54 N-terminal domain-containing protein n=1 Tax=Coemansia brasiliensis TaxID=2650707 RepID=A0A9W8I2V9_9FUNG|nr:hypothetical protein IWW36_005979 [Coemansia brasiliensis]
MNENNYLDIDDLGDLALFIDDAKAIAKIPGKVSSPSATDNEQHYIDILLDAYYQLLAFPPKKSRKSCVGTLEPGQGHVLVTKPNDPIARTAGRTVNGVIHLEPEEWLQFYERGLLTIVSQNEQINKQVSLNMYQAWSYALGTGKLDLDVYRGYAYLRRLGYISVCARSSTANDKSTDCSRQSAEHQQQQSYRLSHCPAFTYSDILSNLLCSASHTITASTNIVKSASATELASGYQIYKPNKPYKKRCPGVPQFHMAISSTLQQFPTAAQLRAITDTQHEISAIMGISELGSITFLKVKAFSVPQVPW